MECIGLGWIGLGVTWISVGLGLCGFGFVGVWNLGQVGLSVNSIGLGVS